MGVKVALNPYQTIGSLFLNRKTLSQKTILMVPFTQFPAEDCDKSYIDEMKCRFSSQLKEHQKAVRHIKQLQMSVLAEHCLILFIPSPGILQDLMHKYKLAYQMPFRGMGNKYLQESTQSGRGKCFRVVCSQCTYSLAI